MITFEENCKEQELVISETDIAAAVKPVTSTVFTVLRAAQKFKNYKSRQNSEANSSTATDLYN